MEAIMSTEPVDRTPEDMPPEARRLLANLGRLAVKVARRELEQAEPAHPEAYTSARSTARAAKVDDDDC